MNVEYVFKDFLRMHRNVKLRSNIIKNYDFYWGDNKALLLTMTKNHKTSRVIITPYELTTAYYNNELDALFLTKLKELYSIIS